VVLLGVAVRHLLQNPAPLKQLAALPLWMWLALLPLAILNYVFVSARMALAVRQAGGVQIAQRVWFRIVVLGQFLNLLVPQLGNVYRGLTLKREFGISYQTYATGLFTFVWLDTMFGFGLCFLVLAVLAPGLKLATVPVLPVIALIILALAFAPLLAARLLGKLRLGPGRFANAQARANSLLVTSAGSLKNPAFALRFLSASALVMADQSLILWLCFRAVGLPIDVASAALFQVVIKLSNQVIITPGNLGVTEMAFGLMGAAARGGSLEYGIAAALVFRMLFTSSVIVMGTMFGGIGLLRSTRAEAPEPVSPS
jgi:uncharacterized membrane protein YbhN (UPF0104 family)